MSGTRSTGAHSHRAEGERRRRRLPLVILAVLALVVAGVVVYLTTRDDGTATSPGQEAAGCDGPSIDIAAAPEIAQQISVLVADAGCEQFRVEAAPPALVSQQVATGKDRPDVWVPDSSLWVARIAEHAPATPRELVPSLASSPVVLVTAEGEVPQTWQAALTDPGMVMGDPVTSVAAAVPLLAGSQGIPEASVVSLAQAQADAEGAPPDDAARLAQVQGGSGLTAVSEQLALSSAPDLTAGVPQPGTVYLDYPVLLTTGEERRADIEPSTTRLVELLSTEEALQALTDAGFRTPNHTPLENGVGDVAPLPVDPAAAGPALEKWAVLAKPTRGLTVIDVSGSMGFDAGGRTRMDITTEAARSTLGLFPGSSALGLWIFSESLRGQLDHVPLVPIRRLDTQVDGATQREVLGAQLATLEDRIGGGTGLYDTAIAAYQRVVDSYDPRAYNTVLLLTDGSNDDPGSPTLEQTVTELRQISDPTRPVHIIAIGISEDADARALRIIAGATGGSMYIARTPDDMATVFADAIAGRR